MLTILLLQASSEMEPFRHLSDYVFGVCNFENTKSMRVILFFKMFKIETTSQKYSKGAEKKVFDSEIIASQLVSLNCPYEEDTFHGQPMC